MLMMSKMKTERLVLSTSTDLTEGKGLYSLAAKDNTGVSVMIWNYQSTKTEGYQVALNLDNLPTLLGNKKISVKAYRIDQHTSNYQNGLENANLQIVEESVATVTDTFTSSINLDPNSLYLVVLEPKK